MALYIARPRRSQVCRLALTLLLVALPLAGARVEPAPPILAPLGAEPVPLTKSLQLPIDSSFQVPALLTSGKLFLGASPPLALAMNLRDQGTPPISGCLFDSSGVREIPNGRSPPRV
jgi:hypothetical protein